MKTLYDSQCPGLSEGDIIWKVNEENVLEFKHMSITDEIVKRVTMKDQVLIIDNKIRNTSATNFP